MNTPWYRTTRVCLVASGAEFGWRNGAGKWPAYYADSLPAVTNVGPGSPTGIGFGYGAKFPAKYQEALYLCDWSYGKLYALHLEPDGSAYFHAPAGLALAFQALDERGMAVQTMRSLTPTRSRASMPAASVATSTAPGRRWPATPRWPAGGRPR